jgi:HlyD family secretion protein
MSSIRISLIYFFFLFIVVSCKDNAVTYDACGYFEAEEWTISSSVAGKLVEFDIKDGDNVVKGQKLGLVDTVQLQLQKDLLLLQPKSKMRDLQEKQINYQLEQCTIRAVEAGVVVGKYAKKGEMIAIGYPLGQIAGMENMYLRMYVTAKQMSDIKIGQEVSITLSDVATRYTGKIEWISSIAEFTPKTIQTEDERQNMVYAVKVFVKNDGAIKIGSYAEVSF